MTAAVEVLRVIAPDHPSLRGHFPERPIVPGVVLLDEVVAAISAWRGTVFVPSGFPSVKFLHPLLPAQDFAIRLRGEGARIEFECMRDNVTLVRGVVLAVVPEAAA